MFKKLLLAVVTLIATMGFAFAQVEVNKADQAALDGVKGIGPATSKIILDERSKGGDFKDWGDFQKRVKGVGDKKAAALSTAGLTVNGTAKTGAAAAKPVSASTRAESKKDSKAAAAASQPAASPLASTPAKK